MKIDESNQNDDKKNERTLHNSERKFEMTINKIRKDETKFEKVKMTNKKWKKSK